MNALALCEAYADATIAALARLASAGALAGMSGSALMRERAELGATPSTRSCRLLEARDGWFALNLARDEDWDLLPAWLETELAPEWSVVEGTVRERGAAELVERGREIGLAVAQDVAATQAAPVVPRAKRLCGGPQERGRGTAGAHPRVIDLSSLWAGPLCGRLLARLGCEVIKVESTQRPDGARRGAAAFFGALNGGKTQVALDFASTEGRRELETLLRSADIVIESSRPRGLRQLGIEAEKIVAETPGLVWIGITGYGRDVRHENWIAYGDDAGVAAGLSHLHWQQTGERAVVGDAVADPLTGIHAAWVAWQRFRSGQGSLVSIALRDVVAQAIAGQPCIRHAPEGAFLGRHDEDRHQGEVSGTDCGGPENVHGQGFPRKKDGRARCRQVQGAVA